VRIDAIRIGAIRIGVIRTGVIALAILGLAACGEQVVSGIPGSASTASPATPAPSVTPVQPSASSSAGIAVDPDLLALLPAAVDDAPLNADHDTARELATDPSLAASVKAIAIAAAFGPPASDELTDYVVATVVRLRPGVFDDAWFRDWRDTFDEGVCAQAGGVDGHAEATIGDHQTFIGTCAGGVRTWHVALPARDVVVSLQGLGPRAYGERVIDGMAE
jgi:hypothetical protein